MKTCVRCKQAKDLSSFNRATANRDGLKSYCRECSNGLSIEWYQKNKERSSITTRSWQKNNRDRHLKTSRKYRQGIRYQVLNMFVGECAHCGIRDHRVLQIDHVNGRGFIERTEIGNNGIMKKILTEGTHGYQLLCANCNWIKRAENNETGLGTKPDTKELHRALHV